ncbi:hypothetical protein BCR34DRAFT_592312 [Clohesyomyces aquaticus]|uniref:Uncharacterized protein n=1 Tax=Clohesyomyces aquaticus TaxID=1231657 RepID=A0A1Y1YTA7_9PLEO|nr:hypothetical protein BCR34DRAFT_592312 [Clohesyomyces aquaticus]
MRSIFVSLVALASFAIEGHAEDSCITGGPWANAKFAIAGCPSCRMEPRDHRMRVPVVNQRRHIQSRGVSLTQSYRRHTIQMAHEWLVRAGAQKHSAKLRTTVAVSKSRVGSSQEITKIELATDLSTWEKAQNEIEEVSLDAVYYENSAPVGGKEQAWEFSGGTEVDWATARKVDTSNLFGGAVGVTNNFEVDIPKVVKYTAEGKWEFNYEHPVLKSEGEVNSDKSKVGWKQSSAVSQPLKPQEAIGCAASTFKGRYDSDFIATVLAKFRDGTSWPFKTKGDLTSVGWTNSVSKCAPVDIKSIPQGQDVMDLDQRKRAVAFLA